MIPAKYNMLATTIEKISVNSEDRTKLAHCKFEKKISFMHRRKVNINLAVLVVSTVLSATIIV